jgi:hypothetical protein
MKLLLLLLVATLAIAASAVEFSAEIKGSLSDATEKEECSETLREEFFTKCIDDIAGSLGFRNRNLRETQRKLDCNQQEWCTNPPPYSYCWLNCRNVRRLILDDTDTKRFLSVLDDKEQLETLAEACLDIEAETYPCLGTPGTIEVKVL